MKRAIQEQVLSRNVERFRGGLVFKAFASNISKRKGFGGPVSRVIQKKKADSVRMVRGGDAYSGTSLIRSCLLLGAYSRPMPRALRWC